MAEVNEFGGVCGRRNRAVFQGRSGLCYWVTQTGRHGIPKKIGVCLQARYVLRVWISRDDIRIPIVIRRDERPYACLYIQPYPNL